MFGALRRGVAPLMSCRQLTTVSSLAETAESLLLQTEAEGGEVGLVLDLTLGSGSDSAHLLETTPATVLGVDVDPRTDSTMARLTEEFQHRFRGCQTAWSELPARIASQVPGDTLDQCDLIMLDLGPSTAQLEEGRGFAGSSDQGLLDMR